MAVTRMRRLGLGVSLEPLKTPAPNSGCTFVIGPVPRSAHYRAQNLPARPSLERVGAAAKLGRALGCGRARDGADWWRDGLGAWRLGWYAIRTARGERPFLIQCELAWGWLAGN